MEVFCELLAEMLSNPEVLDFPEVGTGLRLSGIAQFSVEEAKF